MLKKVKIKILTDRAEAAVGLFENIATSLTEPSASEHSEMSVEGRYHDDGTRVAISYEESAASGMEGTRATISYQKAEPGVISMLRTGSVKTALLFEEGRRHICVYQTPLAPFEVCVQTAKVQNAIETMGTLDLDYIVELKGAQAEHTQMRIVISPVFDKPQGL
jgi:uncharacterized beta-barrel protein YwiB (DUF1934 family)